MNTHLPDGERIGPAVRAPKSQKVCVNVPIFGHRDPRGPDNNLRVWVDEFDFLHIRIEKTNRCYKFAHVIETPGFVEVIAL
jgi:hypothetical protein